MSQMQEKQNAAELPGRPGAPETVPQRLALAAYHSLAARLSAAALLVVPSAVAVGLLVLGIEADWPPLHRLDQSVADTLHRQALAHPEWVRAMLDVSNVFSPLDMRIAVGVAAVVLWLRKARRLAVWAVFTMAAGGLVDTVLKTAVGRARPSFADPVATAPGASFPSGHSFTSMLGAGVLVLLVLPLLPPRGRIAAWVVGACIPLAVGYSRVALGVHWVSDVLGGWILGAGLLAVTTKVFEAWRRAEGRPEVHAVLEGVAPEETEIAVHPQAETTAAENPVMETPATESTAAEEPGAR
ncbi:MAG TPA: phosphatase PAP2 family protein [Actinocrinis sp.]|nr:phosphatase PAP2 family protein [Actinocrinis sp.]